ncbi:MAG: hypothetical protein M1829_002931 [Trizodia sp. TS-e1964]|nr:MAG: hypothetical protein M1829_002931 [Trizodia sp. TS-e1964]
MTDKSVVISIDIPTEEEKLPGEEDNPISIVSDDPVDVTRLTPAEILGVQFDGSGKHVIILDKEHMTHDIFIDKLKAVDELLIWRVSPMVKVKCADPKKFMQTVIAVSIDLETAKWFVDQEKLIVEGIYIDEGARAEHDAKYLIHPPKKLLGYKFGEGKVAISRIRKERARRKRERAHIKHILSLKSREDEARENIFEGNEPQAQHPYSPNAFEYPVMMSIEGANTVTRPPGLLSERAGEAVIRHKLAEPEDVDALEQQGLPPIVPLEGYDDPEVLRTAGENEDDDDVEQSEGHFATESNHPSQVTSWMNVRLPIRGAKEDEAEEEL